MWKISQWPAPYISTQKRLDADESKLWISPDRRWVMTKWPGLVEVLPWSLMRSAGWLWLVLWMEFCIWSCLNMVSIIRSCLISRLFQLTSICKQIARCNKGFGWYFSIFNELTRSGTHMWQLFSSFPEEAENFRYDCDPAAVSALLMGKMKHKGHKGFRSHPSYRPTAAKTWNSQPSTVVQMQFFVPLSTMPMVNLLVLVNNLF